MIRMTTVNVKDEEIPKNLQFHLRGNGKEEKISEHYRDPPKSTTQAKQLPTSHCHPHAAKMKINCISSLPSNSGIMKMQAQNSSKAI